MTDEQAGLFDPSKYLTLVNGKEYLEVKWRLKWFRSEHPDGVIMTEMIAHDEGIREATFRAVITIPDGGSASGHKTEDAKGFGDYREKAETGAIGRALAALGFGTQFCNDFDSGFRVVDSPVERPAGGFGTSDYRNSEHGPSGAATGSPARGSSQSARSGSSGIKEPSERQWGMFNKLVEKHHLNASVVATEAAKYPLDRLSSGGMSKCLDQLMLIDKGEMDIPGGWHLHDEERAIAKQPDTDFRTAPRPPAGDDDGAGLSTGEQVTMWTANIAKASSSRALDAIYKALEAAGLQDNQELLGQMSAREEQLVPG